MPRRTTLPPGHHLILNIVYIYINKYLSACLYAFLNGWTDCDEILYRDRLDLWEADMLINCSFFIFLLYPYIRMLGFICSSVFSTFRLGYGFALIDCIDPPHVELCKNDKLGTTLIL